MFKRCRVDSDHKKYKLINDCPLKPTAPPGGISVADKLAKQVDETYVQKEDDDKQDKEKKAAGRKTKKNEKKFLPAVKWALVYRALKPLLRPCGDLGEGRLDFYHRSISKAVRRK